jgi:hypothetical protein
MLSFKVGFETIQRQFAGTNDICGSSVCRQILYPAYVPILTNALKKAKLKPSGGIKNNSCTFFHYPNLYAHAQSYIILWQSDE